MTSIRALVVSENLDMSTGAGTLGNKVHQSDENSIPSPISLDTPGSFVLWGKKKKVVQVPPFHDEVQEVRHCSLWLGWIHNLQGGHLQQAQPCFIFNKSIGYCLRGRSDIVCFAGTGSLCWIRKTQNWTRRHCSAHSLRSACFFREVSSAPKWKNGNFFKCSQSTAG